MSKQDNIYNLAGQYNSRLHISNFIEPLIEPLKKKYGVKVDELSILWDQVFEDQYKDQVYPKKITTEYRFINGAKKIYRKLHLEVSGSSTIEMQYRRNSIIERVNEIYGQNFISDLVIKNKPNKDNEINKNDIDVLKPHKIEDRPIPINIIVIVPDRLHLSLSQPKGIAPSPINRAPKVHNRIS